MCEHTDPIEVWPLPSRMQPLLHILKNRLCTTNAPSDGLVCVTGLLTTGYAVKGTTSGAGGIACTHVSVMRQFRKGAIGCPATVLISR